MNCCWLVVKMEKYYIFNFSFFTPKIYTHSTLIWASIIFFFFLPFPQNEFFRYQRIHFLFSTEFVYSFAYSPLVFAFSVSIPGRGRANTLCKAERRIALCHKADRIGTTIQQTSTCGSRGHTLTQNQWWCWWRQWLRYCDDGYNIKNWFWIWIFMIISWSAVLKCKKYKKKSSSYSI